MEKVTWLIIFFGIITLNRGVVNIKNMIIGVCKHFKEYWLVYLIATLISFIVCSILLLLSASKFLDSFANWLSGVGTVGAVVVSLYLANRKPVVKFSEIKRYDKNYVKKNDGVFTVNEETVTYLYVTNKSEVPDTIDLYSVELVAKKEKQNIFRTKFYYDNNEDYPKIDNFFNNSEISESIIGLRGIVISPNTTSILGNILWVEILNFLHFNVSGLEFTDVSDEHRKINSIQIYITLNFTRMNGAKIEQTFLAPKEILNVKTTATTTVKNINRKYFF
ncbi:hypothetical protein [Pediococcus pentosaceus]|uniref:hypothetical protein n=1 Tax=Pediococcus pentosaceus TaxID=1255 RepID=UPI001F2594FB|nr:hypothetical protein [Pediococcus pentosaceus]